jgi:alanyl-tRNA synthetase
MDVTEEVWRLRDEVEDLETTIEDLEGQLAEFQLEELRTQVQERDGREWLAGAVEGLDANALSDHAKALAGDAAGVVALVGQDGRTFVVVADHGESDAAAVVQDVTDEFGGGGGGSPQFAQGGGIDADPTAVVGYLREPAADQE